MGSAKRQIESHWEEPVNNQRNEAEVRERAMQHNRRYPSHPSAPLVSDLLTLLEEKDKVIEKLPVTANGVRVVPGMTVYRNGRGRASGKIIEGVCRMDGPLGVRGDEPRGDQKFSDIPSADWSDTFSTREAALAAREQSEGGG